MKITNDARYIIDKLQKAGFEAYIVGGCVRDSILGLQPKDWDITTSARPDEVKKVFEDDVIIPTGEKYGTLSIYLNGVCYEVTTYRADGEYKDGRRPEAVRFSSNLEEDIKRRDLTINALAYNDKDGIVDFYDGVKDIKEKKIRCVGNARDRFNEDALRIMRCFRFAFKLNFEIEAETLKAAYELKDNLSLISKERIREELVKILQYATYEQLQIFKPILVTIIPELKACNECDQVSQYHPYNVLDHSLKAVSLIDDNTYGKLIMLLHDVGKPLVKTTSYKFGGKMKYPSVFNETDHFPQHAAASYKLSYKIMKDLKFDGKTIDVVTKVIKYHAERVQIDDVAVRIFSYTLGYELFDLWIKARVADVEAQNSQCFPKRAEKAMMLKKTFDLCKQHGQLITIKDLAIDGRDIIDLGFNGKIVGQILNECLMLCLTSPLLNDKQYLLSLIKYKYL